MEAEQDPNKKMFKKEKWKIWSTDQNPRIRHCVANPFFSFSSSFSSSFFFFLFSVLYRSKISFLAEMAGTNQYNLISEAVRITAISVLVWALVQKILAGQNSLPRLWCFCWVSFLAKPSRRGLVMDNHYARTKLNLDPIRSNFVSIWKLLIFYKLYA